MEKYINGKGAREEKKKKEKTNKREIVQAKRNITIKRKG